MSTVHLGMDADLEKARFGAEPHKNAVYVEARDHFNGQILREIVAEVGVAPTARDGLALNETGDVMSDVSGRVLGLFAHAEKRYGVPRGQLFQGLSISAERAPERVDWNVLCELFRRLEALVGPEEELAKLGMDFFQMPEFSGLVDVLRLVASPKLLYWASAQWGGPRMFPNLKETHREEPRGSIRLSTEIPEAFEACPQLLWFNLGFYRALPRVLGLGLAHVDAEIGVRRATYVVTPPPSLTLWSRAKHMTRAITSAGSAVQELATLNASLQRQFQSAEQARQDAERQRAEAELARDAAIRAQADADKARLDAEDALRVKSEFLATISHELRTPLNGVLGMTSILLDTPLDADQLECVETIRLSGETLLTLISDILDFARIDAGRLAVNAASFDLSALVEEILQVTSSRAHDKGLELTSSFPATVPRVVVGDAERIRQVLLNLVGNAIKFTDKGHVHLAVTSTAIVDEKAKLVIAVEDSGIGIARGGVRSDLRGLHPGRRFDDATLRRERPRLDDLAPPGRADGRAPPPRERGGSRQHLRDRARAPGRDRARERRGSPPAASSPSSRARAAAMVQERLPGARRARAERSAAAAMTRIHAAAASGDPFGLVLVDFDADEQVAAELARAIHERAPHPRPTVALLAPITRHKDAGRALFVDRVVTKPVRRAELTAVASTAVAAPRRSDPRSSVRSIPKRGRGRVLVVDDNRINQLVVARMVSSLGYEAAVVADGLEAITAMQTERFDAVLMDWHMPELDGLSATRRIKSMGGVAATTPIIGLTASAFPQDRDACLAAGMSDYVAKPVDMRALGEALGRWIPAREEIATRTG